MKIPQKTIGLLGGMTWDSTILYYRLINQRVARKLGGLHSAKLALISVDFDEIEKLQHADKWDEAGAMLADAARHLERAGAECVVICSNTMHKVACQIAGAVTIPLLHIADTVVDDVAKAGCRKVGLLGTKFTMEDDFYRERLTARGLEVMIPDRNNRIIVHRVVYQELCNGILREQSRVELTNIIAGLVAEGAEGIILGSTEIGLLIQKARVPLFDATTIHAQAAANFAV